MRLTMKARQEVTTATAGQYLGATKKEKGKILDQFVATTGYSRWYARLVLRHEGRRIQTAQTNDRRGGTQVENEAEARALL